MASHRAHRRRLTGLASQLALDGDLARDEPKSIRFRILHTAARLVRSGRRRRLKIPATWPWAEQITTAYYQITAPPQAL